MNVVLYLTHRNSDTVINEFKRISNEINNEHTVIFTYHNSDGVPDNIKKHNPFIFTNDILNELGYHPISDSLLPGSNHFPLLKFFKRKNSNYDYYWVIEDDVRFTGNWGSFFNEISEFDHDFISCNVRTYSEFPNWFWWNAIKHPNESIKLEKRVRSFNPIYRISRKALEYIHQSLHNEWEGHHEVIFTTLLYNGGFKIGDFGGDSGFNIIENNRFYIDNITMRYRPNFKKVGNIQNKLYHPVKDF